ncbi:MAG: phytanoyl-CoA dioxygenase family protein, partial [Acidimicrobiia bacterium]
WHQDGAFLGRGIRALNIWLSLSHCGTDAPSLDILPRRLDDIVETGTHGSYFDWAVGPELVEELARETPVVRPAFGPGDVLLFDDMLLHRTATDPSMSRARYAIETWCFAPSHYPEGHVPLVW